MTLPEPTLENAKHAAQHAMEWHGRDVLERILKKFNAKSVSSVALADRPAFMNMCYHPQGHYHQQYPQGPRPEARTPDLIDWWLQ